MKVKQIVETTSAGAIASVAAPLGATQKRAGSLFKGKKTKKKFYEGKMKELAYDIQYLDNGNFQKKYGKSKEEMKNTLGNPPPIKEDEIVEADLIVVPGQMSKREKGFIPHDKVRTDHEVEMARSDLFQAAKNAQKVYNLIKNISEDQGLEGWVQEKIIKANDYLNTIREYLEHKHLAEQAQLQYYNVLVYDAEDGEFYIEVTASSDEEAHNKAMYIAKNKFHANPIGTDIQYPDGPPQMNNEGAGVIAGGQVQEISDFKKKELEWELRNEPKNNYQVSIDGRAWKVFADKAHAEAVARKLRAKGKKAEVHITGASVSEEKIDEKKDACYSKVKSRYKVWPSAYASGALSKCRKVGASNWGNKSKK